MKNKLHYLVYPVFIGMFNIGTAHALVGASTTNTFLGVNYGEEVLNAVLSNWKNPDTSVTGVTSLTIRVAKDGRPYSCEIKRKSSSEIVDNSICQTVAEIGNFSPLEGIDNGEVYLSFVHDNKPYLDLKTVTKPIKDEGKEEIDSVKNPIDNPIKDLQKQSDVKLDSEKIIEENVPLKEDSTTISKNNNTIKTEDVVKNTQTNEIQTLEYKDPDPYTRKAEDSPKPKNNDAKKTNVKPNPEPKENNVSKNISTIKEEDKVYPPLATEKQPQTLKISKKEALQPPSKNLVDPSSSVKEYSNYILREAAPQFRFPSNITGNYQVIARIDLLADGTLEKATVNKSSGVQALDDEILRVLKSEIKYPPVPSKNKQSLWLTFNIKK